MNVTSVKANNRKRHFEVEGETGRWTFPYAVCDVPPTSDDPIVELFIDPEVACDGFTFRLRSGAEDTVLLDHVLSYNRDPEYMRVMLLFRLTVEVLDAFEETGLSKREVIRRLNTSPAQLYRLLDTTNHTKSVDAMLSLLAVLGRSVELVVSRSRESEPRRLLPA
jgi:hypothetical protein